MVVVSLILHFHKPFLSSFGIFEQNVPTACDDDRWRLSPADVDVEFLLCSLCPSLL